MPTFNLSEWLLLFLVFSAVLAALSMPVIISALHTHRLRTSGGYLPKRWVKLGPQALEIQSISLLSWRFRLPSGASLRLSSLQVHNHFKTRGLSLPLAKIEHLFETQSAVDLDALFQLVCERLAEDALVVTAENLTISSFDTLRETTVFQFHALARRKDEESANRALTDAIQASISDAIGLTSDDAPRTLH